MPPRAAGCSAPPVVFPRHPWKLPAALGARFGLTPAQADWILAVGHRGVNVLGTAPAGTGKSRVLAALIAYAEANEVPRAVTASTGIAAQLLGGDTLHAFAGFGRREMPAGDQEALRTYVHSLRHTACGRRVAKRLRATALLIVDEISMVSSVAWEWLHCACVATRGSAAPFGGMQVVLVGDFLQLPPVVAQSSAGGAGMQRPPPAPLYAAPILECLRLVPLRLWDILRADDARLAEMLGRIRIGRPSGADIALLRSRVSARVPRGAVVIAATNAAVGAWNAALRRERLSDAPDASVLTSFTLSPAVALVDMLRIRGLTRANMHAPTSMDSSSNEDAAAVVAEHLSAAGLDAEMEGVFEAHAPPTMASLCEGVLHLPAPSKPSLTSACARVPDVEAWNATAKAAAPPLLEGTHWIPECEDAARMLTSEEREKIASAVAATTSANGGMHSRTVYDGAPVLFTRTVRDAKGAILAANGTIGVMRLAPAAGPPSAPQPAILEVSTDGGVVRVAPTPQDIVLRERIRKARGSGAVLHVFLVARVYTWPLMLAHALTVHRVQGKTLPAAAVLLDSSMRTPSQAYVALSRVRRLKDLTLLPSPDMSVLTRCDAGAVQWEAGVDAALHASHGDAAVGMAMGVLQDD